MFQFPNILKYNSHTCTCGYPNPTFMNTLGMSAQFTRTDPIRAHVAHASTIRVFKVAQLPKAFHKPLWQTSLPPESGIASFKIFHKLEPKCPRYNKNCRRSKFTTTEHTVGREDCSTAPHLGLSILFPSRLKYPIDPFF